jgi:hypothetical protein
MRNRVRGLGAVQSVQEARTGVGRWIRRILGGKSTALAKHIALATHGVRSEYGYGRDDLPDSVGDVKVKRQSESPPSSANGGTNGPPAGGESCARTQGGASSRAVGGEPG